MAISRYQVLPFYLNVGSMPYFSPPRWTQKFCPITLTLYKPFSSVRAKLLTLWKSLVGQKRGVRKVSFLLGVLQVSMIYTSCWLKYCRGLEQSDRFSYPRLDLCLVKSFLVSPNGLWLRAKFLFVCHLRLPSVLAPFWHVLLVSPSSATRKIRVVIFSSSLLLL